MAQSARTQFDYKDPVTLYRYLTDGGKIIPSRVSKLRLAAQKRLAEAVKKRVTWPCCPLESKLTIIFPA